MNSLYTPGPAEPLMASVIVFSSNDTTLCVHVCHALRSNWTDRVRGCRFSASAALPSGSIAADGVLELPALLTPAQVRRCGG